jgi:hypothetical protein
MDATGRKLKATGPLELICLCDEDDVGPPSSLIEISGEFLARWIQFDGKWLHTRDLIRSVQAIEHVSSGHGRAPETEIAIPS